ncbi:uncharacterized protein Dvir_GJ26237 [Drosophila virilis]|uniref:Uncharacterized protein n=1 Tax=Drosophila virilis TaxID=7244 RepID=A0A0Q9W5P9_DROVI|nr:uncharacterized protein Dvir_GJ26237 [Drosophila virilis]
MFQFDALEAEEELLIDFRNVSLVGRHRALNGTVYILEDMDGEHFQFSLDFRYDPERNGQWQPALRHVPIMNICRAMELFIGTFAKSTFRMDENTNLPFDGKSCPLPKGTYYIKNMLLNTDTWPDLINFGGLELNLRFYKNGKSIGGASCKTIMEERLR